MTSPQAWVAFVQAMPTDDTTEPLKRPEAEAPLTEIDEPADLH
jgi:hypothetical protein